MKLGDLVRYSTEESFAADPSPKIVIGIYKHEGKHVYLGEHDVCILLDSNGKVHHKYQWILEVLR